jgi:hypothetical protein
MSHQKPPQRINAPQTGQMLEVPDYLERVPATVAPAQIIVHNRVRPVAWRSGVRGSRFWLANAADVARYERCDCSWAPHLSEHYRSVVRAVEKKTD